MRAEEFFLYTAGGGIEPAVRGINSRLVRDNGTSVDVNTLAKRMRKHLNCIGVRGFTIHGLRHLRGMELAEAGCSEFEIMAQLGHVTPQMAAHYTKAARRKSLAASAAKKLEAGERTIVKLDAVKPPGKVRNRKWWICGTH